jgi:hypothetical protein
MEHTRAVHKPEANQGMESGFGQQQRLGSATSEGGRLGR